MNKKVPCLLIFLALSLAATCTALQSDLDHPAKNARADQAWREYMSDMSKMHATVSSVQTSVNPDLDFVRLMLPHHQAAIDMAKTELLYGKDQQLRRLAQEIVTDQHSEIELMQLWLQRPEPGSQKSDDIPSEK